VACSTLAGGSVGLVEVSLRHRATMDEALCVTVFGFGQHKVRQQQWQA
jgi:hypothetical protein